MNLGLAIPAGILTVVAAGTCETHISLERRYVYENALQPKQIYLSRALGLSTRSVRKQWFDIRIISSGRTKFTRYALSDDQLIVVSARIPFWRKIRLVRWDLRGKNVSTSSSVCYWNGRTQLFLRLRSYYVVGRRFSQKLISRWNFLSKKKKKNCSRETRFPEKYFPGSKFYFPGKKKFPTSLKFYVDMLFFNVTDRESLQYSWCVAWNANFGIAIYDLLHYLLFIFLNCIYTLKKVFFF